MISRYRDRQIFKNDLDIYKELFRNRNVKFINTFETPRYIFPNGNEISKIQIITHIWSVGDKYYKLADIFYGDPRDWWVIAKFNQKPTESHVKTGDIILIPKPLNLVVNYLRG
jgi:hypothetical protein